MRTITLEEALKRATKGPITLRPFLTPDKDADPMGVYDAQLSALQDRYDKVDGWENEDEEWQKEVDSIHDKNGMTAALLAHCYNHFEEAVAMAQAALAYDSAINKASAMGQSWVQDDSLDALYLDWQTKASSFLAKATTITLPT